VLCAHVACYKRRVRSRWVPGRSATPQARSVEHAPSHRVQGFCSPLAMCISFHPAAELCHYVCLKCIQQQRRRWCLGSIKWKARAASISYLAINPGGGVAGPDRCVCWTLRVSTCQQSVPLAGMVCWASEGGSSSMHLSVSPCFPPPCPLPQPLCPAEHPLDQLTPNEVSRASAAVRAHAAAEGLVGSLRFNTIMLQEPPKAQLLAYEAGTGPKPARVAAVWVLHPSKNGFYEAVVQLPEAGGLDAVVSWKKVRALARHEST
jgi:Cu2+-containing amine oxidase